MADVKLPDPLTEVRLNNLNYTFGHWLPRTDRPNLFDLNAPYQRGSVWTFEQRQALIRSLIQGIPIGAVIISVLWPMENQEYDYRIVDGKQRIETVRMFANDEFTIPGWWLIPRYTEHRDRHIVYSDLTETGRRHFEMSTPVPCLEFNATVKHVEKPAGRFVNRKQTPEAVLRDEAILYGLVNGGGTPQTAEDMARARAIVQPGYGTRNEDV